MGVLCQVSYEHRVESRIGKDPAGGGPWRPTFFPYAFPFLGETSLFQGRPCLLTNLACLEGDHGARKADLGERHGAWRWECLHGWGTPKTVSGGEWGGRKGRDGTTQVLLCVTRAGKRQVRVEETVAQKGVG